PENVLVTRDCLNVKLIDFGLSTSETWCREIGCGSAYYMSPECQGGINGNLDRYAAAPNDVWALGVILINLATGRNPWNRAHTSDPLFRRYLTDKTFLCRAIRATPQFEQIVHRVLDTNPNTRCTLQELRQLVLSCPQFVEPASSSRTQQASPAYIAHSANKDAANGNPVPYRKKLQTTSTSSAVVMPNQAAAAAPSVTAAHAAGIKNNGVVSVDVAQRQTPALLLQPQSPVTSTSASSTDSALESMLAGNRLPGYPPLYIPGLDKASNANVGHAAVNVVQAAGNVF
ncbi:Serine/threonine protein kinase, partial [Coemansia sp. RSA 2607]